MADFDASRYDVCEYGATGGDDDTEAIQAALDDCAGAGGTVFVPPGEYLTGPLRVGDDTTLHLDAGATLQFVGDHEAFPSVESRWEGWEQTGFHPCLFVADATNVAITGRGTIDGGGEYWWEFYEIPDAELPERLRERLAEFAERNEKQDDVSSFTLRPPLLQIRDSENVSVSGVTLRNSPFWNTHVLYSEDVTIHDARIENPADAPNGDGIDVDSSRFVKISDTYISAGDDAICIKSGKNREGREIGQPASQITVTNCTVEAGHGGIVIGSEMSGDVRDIAVSNCTFTDTDRGVRIKTQRNRGGVVEDLRFDTLVMRRVACPFVINGYYFTDIDAEPIPIDDGTPLIRNVHFHNITVSEAESAGFFAGLPEQPVADISFNDVRIDATRSLDATDLSPAMAENYEQQHGLYCTAAATVSFDDVWIRTPDAPALQFEATDAISIDGLRTVDSQPSPTVEVADVGTVLLRGCSALGSDGSFLLASGPVSERISLGGNHGSLADHIEITDEAGNVIIEQS